MNRLTSAVAIMMFSAGLLAPWEGHASWHEDAPAFSGLMRDYHPLVNPRALPEYDFSGPDGGALTFEDFEGKVLLLNFWATWCPPCVEEMPSLDRLQSMRDIDRFEVVALSLDKSLDLIHEFYEKYELVNLAAYRDHALQSMAKFSVGGLPTSFIIGAEGHILGTLAGPAEWDSAEANTLISYFVDRIGVPVN